MEALSFASSTLWRTSLQIINFCRTYLWPNMDYLLLLFC